MDQHTDEHPLAGALMYAFGDGIVAGHAYPQASFATVVAEREGMRLERFAVNGATICDTPLRRPHLSGMVLRQIEGVPAGAPAPDLVLFDGGTNDGWLLFRGELDVHGDPVPGAHHDAAEYAACFERTIGAIRRRWPQAVIVYVAVARMTSPDRAIQDELHRIAMDQCARHGVTVANVYEDADLDTAREADRLAWSFDDLGSDGLPATERTTLVPYDGARPSGTHPNLPAVERFYAPVVIRALRAAWRSPEPRPGAGARP
ncbi:SGNH/GDSL hydrolase family protein [Bifidobacterium pullorum subsp. saeculare]|uniref:SGNH/GDSL hydrolase family protein n=1 Tax=Bifidobacterium pullorum subsp. saeculare TaxID=78257 RepID=A0A938WYH8_9BIFI|nr:SGNH/GDSL hydrolase family protein [Bifidobacterium pullorum]MBM6699958.1 SGNH/GDSL hydrolase family protein [Bifidobacterium pullorum subsp. saeculare]